jgi:hypothetical protein
MKGHAHERRKPQDHHIERGIKETRVPNKPIEMKPPQNRSQNEQHEERLNCEDE